MSCNNSSSQVRKEIQNNLPSDPVVGKIILYIMSSPGLIPWKTQLRDIQNSMSTPVLGISYKFHVQYWTYSMNTPVLESSVTPCPILDLFHEHPSTGKFIYSMSNTGLIPWTPQYWKVHLFHVQYWTYSMKRNQPYTSSNPVMGPHIFQHIRPEELFETIHSRSFPPLASYMYTKLHTK